MDTGEWTLIESDPGVFTELIQAFGVQGLEVEELLDLEWYGQTDVYGFIFLFKWDPSLADAQTREPLPWDSVPDVWFARQAILSVLMNMPSDVSLGNELAQFKEFTSQFDPELKGHSITNSDTMRAAHNSFALADMFDTDDQTPKEKKEDAFHFSAYIPMNGIIYELDGLKSGPIHVGEYDPANPSSWPTRLVEIIRQRVTQTPAELRFSLMAIGRSQRDHLSSEIAQIEAQMSQMDLSGPARTELEQRRTQILSELVRVEERLEKYKRENLRRRHNFVPLILEALRQLAQTGAIDKHLDEVVAKRQGGSGPEQQG